MGYLADTSITETVPLAGGKYSATVRALRANEEDAVLVAFRGSKTIKAAGQVGTDGTSNSALNMEFDEAAQMQATLLYGITAWNLLEDDDTTVWPIDAAHLGQLTGGDRNALYVAISNLTSPPSEELKNN